MLKFLQKRWFLVSLVILISSGLTIGAELPAEKVKPITGVFHPRVITSLVLFLMAFSLDSRQLRSSFQSPGPVVWASLLNYGFIPLLAWGFTAIQLTPDFAIGLMIAASVPCTMAAASVWTRKAKGNDAVSLMVTASTNGLCFLITPFWLNLTTAISSDVQLDAKKMVLRLLLCVLVPALIGQIVRQFPRPARFAISYKTPIGVVAQCCMLTLVFSAACNAGGKLHAAAGATNLGAIALVWGSCIVVHLTAMAVGITGARRMGFKRADRAAIAFASSQKTLPIGVLLATDPTMFGDPNLLGPGIGIPFAVFPMLMFHASQLFIDTAVADRLAAQAQPEESSR